jgi:hypothetical protein
MLFAGRAPSGRRKQAGGGAGSVAEPGRRQHAVVAVDRRQPIERSGNRLPIGVPGRFPILARPAWPVPDRPGTPLEIDRLMLRA